MNKPEKTLAKPDAASPAAAGPEASGRLVEILAPAGPRRRAGMEFGPTPTVVDPAELDEIARTAIEADPFLTVRRHRPREAEPTSA